MSACANPACPNPATREVKIWSWFKEQRRQTPLVYLVCDEDAARYFPRQSGRFDEAKAELIEGGGV